MDEELYAWYYDVALDDAICLGPVKEGLGWVAEENLQKMADDRPHPMRIFFFRWNVWED